MDEKATIRFVLIGVKYSQSDLGKHYKTFCGLYIPSVKQLTYLYQQIGLVNQRTEAVGGLPISLQPGDCWLWTSTEAEGQKDSKAWLFSMQSGTIQETPKDQAHKFRPVISIY